MKKLGFSISFFLFIFFLFTFSSIFCHCSAAEIEWQQEFGAMVNGEYLAWAYFGGLAGEKPTFVDIDNDGDYDLFIGESDGTINFYRNDGTPESPNWTLVTENYNSIDVGDDSAPTFIDIDSDGDYDMFIGGCCGNINFYRNDGTPEAPAWILVTISYNSIVVKYHNVPTFIDIDGDNDYDMFIGEDEGNIHFYRNDGTPESPNWTLVTENYNSIDVGGLSTPTFIDIDGDADYDMFIGEDEGNINFYRNDGTPESPSWALVTENYNLIDVGGHSSPTFIDIDSDGDYDMFIGESDGTINFYQNDGTPEAPNWTLVTTYNSIDVGDSSSPTFIDIDSDGDCDMFIGEEDGTINFYRNDGTPEVPSWTLVIENYNSIDVERYSAPIFTDIDNDGDYDLFIGEWRGNIHFYQNDGTPESPSWVLVTENYNSIDVGWNSIPVFTDIDNDGDYDMFIGESGGNINFYRNDGTPTSPSWTLVNENYNSIDEWHSAPFFSDIDGDNDYDMFIGEDEGNINFYRNDGTPDSPSWTLITENYNSISVNLGSTPAFCDIDSDGDSDMFIGEEDGNINFYRNMTYRLLAGDVNRDCKVNILDLVFVRNHLGQDPNSSPEAKRCDVNGDGKINILDLVFVRNHLGTSCE